MICLCQCTGSIKILSGSATPTSFLNFIKNKKIGAYRAPRSGGVVHTHWGGEQHLQPHFIIETVFHLVMYTTLGRLVHIPTEDRIRVFFFRIRIHTFIPVPVKDGFSYNIHF